MKSDRIRFSLSERFRLRLVSERFRLESSDQEATKTVGIGWGKFKEKEEDARKEMSNQTNSLNHSALGHSDLLIIQTS
ncbi:hypothetical protein QVD17_35749 [Tagetes erecta]|uniref:Uncharacterized protein n=1 Tax=Tagetes erecta TaxID=13708 RepID=A0AAD8JR45_TARER|nr:hypothetical protein QVD17_35749 [Tagetes erecta]